MSKAKSTSERPERVRTPSFVLEVPLVVTPKDARTALVRLEAARRVYNATLGDALRVLDRLRASPEWAAARALPKDSEERPRAFKAARKAHGFEEYAMQAFATGHKNAGGFANRLGAHETQKIGTRVWNAVNACALGQRGRPRFKGRGRPLKSLEGKSKGSGLRWNPGVASLYWGDLILPARLPSATEDPWLLAGLEARTKYARIVWRTVRGKRRWYAQLIQEGLAPPKARAVRPEGVVGLDLGPSTVAIVGDAAVALERLAPSIEQPWAEQRRLQRAQDRSRRAMNPDNYDALGRAKRGRRRWETSVRYRKRAARLAAIEARLAAGRKRDHGNLVNRILAQGCQIRTEKLSMRAFQKAYGRSVKVRAPGAFLAELERKAERAGGQVEWLETRTLKLSQYDHVTGTYEKKPLSQRTHPLGGGAVQVQRDAYSAFLAREVEDGAHNPSRLETAWAATEALLRRAGLCRSQATSGRPLGWPTVKLPPSESLAR